MYSIMQPMKRYIYIPIILSLLFSTLPLRAQEVTLSGVILWGRR